MLNSVPWKNLFDKVVVVSLPSSKKRRSYIKDHLPSVGIHSFEFFDATSMRDPAVALAYERGEVATFPPCFRCGQLDCGDPDCNNFLIPQQVATFITYLRLWQWIIAGQGQRILVLEDDVRIHDHAAQVLTWLEQEIFDGHVPFRAGSPCLVRLGWALSKDHSATDQYFVNETVKMSNPCHALTQEYAALLLERVTGIIHTVDVYQHALAPNSGEAFTVFPPIASELSWTDGVFPSTIHPKPVHSTYLRSLGDNDGAVHNENLIRQHIKKKYFRSLLIVGHPRCGSGYAANLCQQMGLDIGHEKLGDDGISLWMFAVEADENPYALDAVARTRRALSWEYMVMPVRDLSTAAGSVIRDSTYAPQSYAFRREYILRLLGLDLDQLQTSLERAVMSVIGWCKIIVGQNPDFWFRIEDQHKELQEFLIENNLCDRAVRDQILDTSPVNTNKLYKGVRYPKPTIDPIEWNNLPEATKSEISWYCDTFGYNSPLA